MKTFNRLLSSVLLASLLLSGNCTALYGASGDAVNTPSPAPGDMKTELLENALGISPANPYFSWTMNSDSLNIKQTAYQIVVTSTEKNMEDEVFLYDSGWVASSKNTNVALNYSFDYNSLYYWKVRTKDNYNSVSDWSEPTMITTAVGDENWASADGIWGDIHVSGSNPFYLNGWTDYTVEMDLNILASAAGIMFRAQDTSDKPDALSIDSNGIITCHHNAADVTITASTDKYGETTVSFSDNNFSYGETLYSNNFDSVNGIFGTLAISNGSLVVGKGKKVMANTGSDWTDYIISADMTITNVAGSLTFRAQDSTNNYYLWQFRADNQSLKTHVICVTKRPFIRCYCSRSI